VRRSVITAATFESTIALELSIIRHRRAIARARRSPDRIRISLMRIVY